MKENCSDFHLNHISFDHMPVRNQITQKFSYFVRFLRILIYGSLALYLSSGGDEQTKAFYGNIDSNTHASKLQVTLSHYELESFVQGLNEEKNITQC